mgnify:CR=1 FL=1
MRTQIMSSAQINRTLNRLAYEIVERNRGADNLVVIGIQRSGAVVATQMANHINQIEDTKLVSVDLDVTAFRDDTPHDGVGVELPDLTAKDVILVDDVLFTGRTARAGLDAVIRSGRPKSIQLLVLIDRGHREYPIQPDYVGREIPTKHNERVEVDTQEMVVYVVE